jgi:hypothetical protein
MAMKATPAMPSARPQARRSVSRSRRNIADMTAAQIGAVALITAISPAPSCSAA